MAQKVDDDSARLILMELAEAFGAKEDEVLALMPVATEGRLYLENGKAVYQLRAPIELKNDTNVETFALREPTAADFLAYSKGMVVTVSREGSTEIDMVMMGRRTMRAVSTLADQPSGVADRMSRRDLDDLTKIGDALGFFD